MDRLKKRKVSIFFRRNAYVVEYRDSFGKRVRKAFKEESDAQDEQIKIEARARGVMVVESEVSTQPMTIQDAIKRFKKTASRIGRTATNEAYYLTELYLFLRNECGLMWMSEVRAIHMDELRSKGQSSELANSTIKRKENTFRSFFRKSKSWGVIAKHPMTSLDQLKEDPSDIKTWTTDEIRNDVPKLKPWAQDAIVFLTESGARPVDAERLTYGDFLEEKRVVRLKSFKGKTVRQDFLPLTERALSLLKRLKDEARRKFRARDEDLIFLTAKGTPVNCQNLGQELRRAGVKNTLYGLRHTFADSLVDRNVHARDIQMLMRHAKFETTTRYTHRKPDALRGHVEDLSKARGLGEIFETGGRKVGHK